MAEKIIEKLLKWDAACGALVCLLFSLFGIVLLKIIAKQIPFAVNEHALIAQPLIGKPLLVAAQRIAATVQRRHVTLAAALRTLRETVEEHRRAFRGAHVQARAILMCRTSAEK